MTAGGILEKILDPVTESLTPQAASRILNFTVDSETQSHVDQLAKKAQDGTLSDAEHADYHNLIETFDLVAILKSKARVILKNAS